MLRVGVFRMRQGGSRASGMRASRLRRLVSRRVEDRPSNIKDEIGPPGALEVPICAWQLLRGPRGVGKRNSNS